MFATETTHSRTTECIIMPRLKCIVIMSKYKLGGSISKAICLCVVCLPSAHKHPLGANYVLNLPYHISRFERSKRNIIHTGQ